MENFINRTIVLKNTEGKIFYNGSRSISIENFKGGISLPFTMFRIKNYDVGTQTLYIKIESGSVSEKDFNISTEINETIFNEVVVNNIIIETKTYSPQSYIHPYNPPELEVTSKQQNPPPNKEPTPKIISSTGRIKIEELTFEDGKIIFKTTVPGVAFSGPFILENSFILKRYDPIKPYFAKFFENGKMTFHFMFTFLEGKLIDSKVTSDDLQKINQSLIDIVEDRVISDAVVNDATSTVRGIDEILESTIVSSLNKDAEWLLSKLFEIGKTKHYFHLKFLSSLHQNDIANIKTTGKPFSFIFCISTQDSHYFVWEPYSTEEATYIWRVGKPKRAEVRSQLQKTEELIKDLRNNQKRPYRAQEKNNPDFRVIEHDYSLDKFGFETWKAKFELFVL